MKENVRICTSLIFTHSFFCLHSGTEALVPTAGSNHSSLSAEDRDSSPVSVPVPTAIIGPVIGKAQALVDYIPSPYDKDALKFKVRTNYVQ
jgi:hypothetical protein